jgi:hypothetical protein
MATQVFYLPMTQIIKEGEKTPIFSPLLSIYALSIKAGF